MLTALEKTKLESYRKLHGIMSINEAKTIAQNAAVELSNLRPDPNPLINIEIYFTKVNQLDAIKRIHCVYAYLMENELIIPSLKSLNNVTKP